MINKCLRTFGIKINSIIVFELNDFEFKYYYSKNI